MTSPYTPNAMIAHGIIEAFRNAYKKGYITSFDGNACFVDETGANEYFVTASAIKKDSLSYEHFIKVDDKSTPLTPTHRIPSIETQAHINALKATNKLVSVHFHPPKTLALYEKADRLEIEDVALAQYLNQWAELSRYTKISDFSLPAYVPGSHSLHEGIGDLFSLNSPDIVVMLRHGVFSVGHSLDEALGHIERLEHISQIVLDSGWAG